jgi:hypothetical protein
MSIVEAALTVLRQSGRPLTAAEVYEAIKARGLYSFKAKQPTQIVLQQLRRHCTDVGGKSGSPTKYFARAGVNSYVPLPQPVTMAN